MMLDDERFCVRDGMWISLMENKTRRFDEPRMGKGFLKVKTWWKLQINPPISIRFHFGTYPRKIIILLKIHWSNSALETNWYMNLQTRDVEDKSTTTSILMSSPRMSVV